MLDSRLLGLCGHFLIGGLRFDFVAGAAAGVEAALEVFFELYVLELVCLLVHGAGRAGEAEDVAG